MVIFLANLQSISPDLYEAAEIDGKTYDILRGYGLRGTYAIRCRER